MSTNVRPETMARITTPALAQAFIEDQVAQVRAQVGDKKVLLALSGGVDSSVVAALLIKAIGKQLVCVHVNHGLMRKGESEQVIQVFGKEMDANLIYMPLTASWICWPVSASRRRSAKSSAVSSSRSLTRRLPSWRALTSWLRAPFIPTFWSLTA